MLPKDVRTHATARRPAETQQQQQGRVARQKDKSQTTRLSG